MSEKDVIHGHLMDKGFKIGNVIRNAYAFNDPEEEPALVVKLDEWQTELTARLSPSQKFAVEALHLDHSKKFKHGIGRELTVVNADPR